MTDDPNPAVRLVRLTKKLKTIDGVEVFAYDWRSYDGFINVNELTDEVRDTIESAGFDIRSKQTRVDTLDHVEFVNLTLEEEDR